MNFKPEKHSETSEEKSTVDFDVLFLSKIQVYIGVWG